MYTVYIAEKPDIARAIAAHIWPDATYQKNKYDITNGDTVICWCHGHILRPKEPEEYDTAYKSWSEYQVFPPKWAVVPMANEKDLLTAIASHLKKADVVIHAGDPDREGQLLVDEILIYCGYKGPVKRLLINAKDDVSMQRGFASMEDNQKYKPLYESALARQQADWLVGMNLTRAYTTNARKYGYDTVWRIGRVQIPTLALVVRREREINAFKSKTYYELLGTFAKDNIPFKAKLVPDEDLPIDEENRVLDEHVLKAVKEKVSQANATVETVEEKEGTKQPPLPHSLDTLQVLANKKLGLSPGETLATVQALYEKKYVTYPRSDCNYIPSSQKDDAQRILVMLQNYGLPAAITANPAITSKAFNDAKVTAHHAIIPTGVEPQDLNDKELKIYQLIAEYYCYQFYDPYRFKKVSFTIKAADCLFKGSGTLPITLGFMQIYGEKEKPEDNAVLPTLKPGDEVTADYAIAQKKTTPPKRFTEGTLLAAMTNIWRFIASDNPNREKLKEVKGIGTPATRDQIIAKLEATNGKGHKLEPYITKKGKSTELIPTPIGCALIDTIDQSLTYPDTTAVMEYELSNIASGKISRDAYITTVIDLVNRNVTHAETVVYPAPPGKKIFACPICKTGQLLRKYSAKHTMHFWICSNKDCISPVTKQTVFYEDHDGEPVLAFCPHDNAPLSRWKGKYGHFWKCRVCNSTYNDANGKPDFTKKKKSAK